VDIKDMSNLLKATTHIVPVAGVYNFNSHYADGEKMKISKSDLLEDAKKKKHRKDPTVNLFYYVVPKELVDDAIDLVKKINSRYGVICFSCPYEGNNSPGIYVVRRAALLKQKEAINPDIFEKLYRRLSYENGRLLMKLAKIELEK
jgi:hypothetical protein